MRTIVFGFDQKKQHSRPKPMFTNKDADMASILANGACFHEVLMGVARITSAHESVHHVMNIKLGFIKRQIQLCREGPRQIRVTAVVVFHPFQ